MKGGEVMSKVVRVSDENYEKLKKKAWRERKEIKVTTDEVVQKFFKKRGK